MARCASCGASIKWARTIKGKAIPLDVDPVPGGNIALDNNLIARVVQAKPEIRQHISHFATCKQADNWRTRRTPSPTTKELSR